MTNSIGAGPGPHDEAEEAVVHELVGPYAVDALDALERARFEEHLRSCPESTREVGALHASLGELSAMVEVPPPAALRGRIVERIARSERDADPVPSPSPTAEQPSRPGPDRRLFLLAAAAAVVAGGGGLVWQRSRQRTGGVSAEQILSAPDAQTETAPVKGGGTATVTRSIDLGRAVLALTDVPVLDQDRVYQAWFATSSGGFVSAGVLRPGGDITVVLQGDSRAAAGVGLTEEPAGGSAQPTSDPVALVTFPA